MRERNCHQYRLKAAEIATDQGFRSEITKQISSYDTYRVTSVLHFIDFHSLYCVLQKPKELLERMEEN